MRNTASRLNASRTKSIFFAGSLIAILVLLFSVNVKAQTYSTVALTGFNADIIANGPTFAGSTTADVDGGGYYFYNQSFTAFGAQTFFLPNSGALSNPATAGAATPAGLPYQLADAAQNNSLRLATNGQSGTLSFVTPISAGIVYVAATSGASASTVNITVNFSDATSQTFTGLNISDWFGGSNFIVQSIGRTTATAIDAGAGSGGNPRIYQLALPLSGANILKTITGITVTKATAAGFSHIMAVSVASACTAPASQPTSLNLTAFSPSQINGSFTASSPAADQYLVVRYATGATPTDPVHGTTYAVGASLGTGTIVSSGTATSFSSTGLSPATGYTYYVYAFNSTSCVGPVYQLTAPLTGTQTSGTCATFSGTFSVGPSGTYPSITAALTAMSGGISGNVILELQPSYTSSVETFPINFDLNPCFSATKTLTIRPAIGATGLSISSSANATIDFNGAKYVTIDGRPGGTGATSQLSIINTAATGITMRFFNDAQNNIVTYCDIQGQNTTSPSSPAGTAQAGVIYFGAAHSIYLQGNDNNSINNSNIHGTATGNPAYGVLASGTTTTVASYNDNNNINNCNIYDYFSAGSASVGIKLDAGTNAWDITNNSFYQTATRTVTAANTHRALWIGPNNGSINNTASGFVVTGNWIGGSSPTAGGTPYTIAGVFGTVFMGMDLSVGLGTATSVQNNVISNLAITSNSAANPYFAGIYAANGNVNIGTSTANLIGSVTGNGSITLTSSGSGGTAWGIRIGGGTSVTQVANGNTVGSITINNGGVSTNFIGIGAASGATTTLSVTNNIIGSATTTNSIQITGTGSATAQSVSGIAITSGASTSTITGNTIVNLTNGYTGTGAGLTRGIALSSGAGSIANNTIFNLRTTSPQVNGGANSSVLGISMTSATLPMDVSGNTIHSLINASSSTTAAIQVTGLFYSGSSGGASTIAKNFIHSLDVTANNTGATVTGIDLAAATATVANNMIRVGIRPDGSSLTNAQIVRGISSNSSSATNNFYHNTVYVGGTGIGTNTANSYAFTRTSTSGTYDIRNNIFVNTRSNSSATGGKHYAIFFTTATTGAAPDYNVYFVNGTGGVFGSNGTDVPAYTAGWVTTDVHSLFADPLFVNPTGNTTAVDLHLQTGSVADGAGIDIPVITDDIDGQLRSGLTPTDIGADAGNYGATGLDVGAIVLVSPAPLNCFSATQQVVVRIKNFSANPINFATNNVTVNVTGTGVVTYNGSVTINTGTLAPGATQDVTIAPTINMAASGIYTFNATTVLAGDVTSLNDAIPASSINYQPLGGVYPVGAGQSTNGGFNTITAAVAAYNAATCFSSPVVFQLTDATYNTATGETFPIVINSNVLASATNTLTIRPAAGVASTITGTSGATASGLIRLNGADYIIIDGLNTGGSTLNVENTSTTGGTAVIWLSSNGVNTGATNNSIRNLTVKAGVDQSTSTTVTYGIVVSGATLSATITSVTAGDDNDNNLIEKNTVLKTRYGIYVRGGSTTNPNQGTIIRNNIVGPASFGSDEIGKVGMVIREEDGIQITGNEVRYVGGLFGNTTTGVDRGGIVLSTEATWTAPTSVMVRNAKVSGNLIHHIIEERTFSSIGILVAGTDANPTNNIIANNMMYAVNANGTAGDHGVGIAVNAGNSDRIVFNTIYLTGDTDPSSSASASSTSSHGISIGSTSPVNLSVKNNIVFMDLISSSATTLRHSAINIPSGFNWGTGGSDFNDLYTNASNTQAYIGTVGGNGGTYYGTLAAWQTATTQDAASISVQPIFLSPTDLHLVSGLNIIINDAGTPITGVTTDYDNQTRNATTPDIGADEFTPPAGVDIAGSTLVEPIVKSCYSAAETVKISIRNLSANTVDFSVTPVTVTVNVTGAATVTLTQVVNTGTLPSGDSLIVTVAPTLNMSAIGTYTFNASAVALVDANTSNNAIIPVIRDAVVIVPGTVNASVSQICNSGTPNLTLTGSAGGNVQWQESTNAGGPWNNVGTNTLTYTPSSPIAATTYYQAVISCNANSTTTNTVQVTVNNPQVLTSNGATRCGPGTLNLTATASAGATLNWYTTATGGTAIGTGASFVTPIINSTITYYVGAEFPMTPVCSSPRIAVTATVTAAPTFDITNDLTICNNAITTVLVNSPSANFNSYTWTPQTGLFTDAAATIPYTGGSATTLYLKTTTAGTQTFIATANNSTTGCQNIDSVRVTVIPAVVSVIPASDQLCVSGSSTLTISPSAATLGAATYQWSSSINNTTYTNIGGATGPSYTTPTISATTYYKVEIRNSAGQICLSPYDTVMVNNPQILSSTPASICGTGTLNLQATANAGSTINWYTAATGGALAGTGATFTTPSLSTTTTYYAAASLGGGATDVGIKPSEFAICGAPVASTATGWALRFNTTKSVIINSAYVIPVSAGTFTVALRNALSATDLQTTTTSFTAAQVGTPVQIPLNFSITTAGSYQLVNTAGGVNRITTLGCGYPFTTPGGGFSIVGSATSSTAANATTFYNAFYQINVSEACESARVAVVATVNANTAITTQPQSQAVCAGANVSFSVVATGASVTYQWKKGATVITGATSATLNLTNVQVSDGGTYTVEVTGTCGTVTSTVVNLSVSPSNAWLGAVSSDWNNGANWCGSVPTATSDVVIPSGTPFSPEINGSASVRNITVNSGAAITLTPAAQFNIYGNYSSSGTINATNGFIYFRGTTAQTVTALTATNIVVNGNGGISLTGNMSVNTLILQNGNITLGANNLTITGSVNGTVASHIVTNGTGSVISNNIGAGPVIIPIGADVASYNPVMIANGQNRNYTVRVATGILPSITDPTRAINRTWSVTPSGAVSSDVSVTLQFANAHGNANFNTGGVVEVGLNTGGIWFFASPPNGLTPLGAPTERQVTVQTQTFGSMMISSPGGMSVPTSVSPVNPDINTITVLPNPVQANGVLRVVTSRAAKLQWRITDVSGRIVGNFSSQLIAGVNNITLPCAMLTAGQYFVTGVGDKGKTKTVRFVKL